MGKWSDLSASQKALIINLSIKNGVSDIKTIRDTYDMYIDSPESDYDNKALAASGIKSDDNGHYSDIFKKPNHPTFSTGSMYHSKKTPGGKWEKVGNKWTYEPSDYVLNKQGSWNNFLRGFANQEEEMAYKDSYPVYNGGVMLPEITVNASKKKFGGSLYHNNKSTGGPLYPFSFNGYIPEVRYKNGGVLGHKYLGGGLAETIKNLFSSNNSEPEQVEVTTTEGKVDPANIASRQAYAESNYDDSAKSKAGAMGVFQIMPSVLADYNKALGTDIQLKSLQNTDTNTMVRNWYMDNLLNASFINKENSTDSVKYGKALGAYNWGRGNLLKHLNEAKSQGIDIYNSWDWVEGLPKETRDYINFILRGQDANKTHHNNSMYNKSKNKNKDKDNSIRKKQ